ncbi:MAG: phage terminase large subunit [Clostridia bacterium]|nr:phage terminase large subunit [Clostridia bacterium]
MSGRQTVRIRGTPNEKQAQFFASRARYTAYGGARGGGKSWALRRKLVGLCLCYPGIRCLLVRRTLVELKANHILPLLSEYGAILRFSSGENAFLMDNGSRIDCGYCDSERDALRYQGQEYDIIAIDEATQLSETQFACLKAALRGVRDMPRRMYLTCNPGGVGHAWVKRLFIDRDFRAGEREEDYCFISARVWDNTVLTSSDPDYVRGLESLPERLRAAWLEGRWDVFEGQFFSEFDEDKHTLGVGEERGHAVCSFAAMDYGFDRLAVLLLSEDERGRLTVERELCRSGLTLGEAARQLESFLTDVQHRVEYVVASPDLWNRRQDSGLSGVAIMMGAAKLPPLCRADDRRVAGWRRLREYLHGKDGVSDLRISKRCTELISCMQSLLCDPHRPEDAASHPHAVTHAPEALRYAVMSRVGIVDGQTIEPSGGQFRFSVRDVWD